MRVLAALLVVACATPTLLPGLYSARKTKGVGLIQLEVRPNGSATLRNVVSVHLPPVEVESVSVKLVWVKGKLCMRPAPQTVHPCFTVNSDGDVALKTLPDNDAVILKKVSSPSAR